MPYTSLTSTTQSGALKVLASTANDFPGLKNTTNGTVRVNFTAKGQWCLYNVPTKDPELVIFNSQTDWKGHGINDVRNYSREALANRPLIGPKEPQSFGQAWLCF